MTGEPTHTASENGAACPNYHLKSKVWVALISQRLMPFVTLT